MKEFIIFSSTGLDCQSVWGREVLILFQVLDLEFKLSYGSDTQCSLNPEYMVFKRKVVYFVI